MDWEADFLSEYLARFYKDAILFNRLRLGAVPATAIPPTADYYERKVWGNIRFWADAVVVTPQKIILIEAKIRPTPGVIGQIEIYRRLLPHTPELKPFFPREVEAQLIYCIEFPLIVALAREKGIRAIQFPYTKLREWMEVKSPREKAVPIIEAERF